MNETGHVQCFLEDLFVYDIATVMTGGKKMEV